MDIVCQRVSVSLSTHRTRRNFLYLTFRESMRLSMSSTSLEESRAHNRGQKQRLNWTMMPKKKDKVGLRRAARHT